MLKTKKLNQPPNMSIKYFANNTELIKQLGAHIIEKLNTALIENNTASLVVSGGSTPSRLFEYLSVQDINWANVTVTLADERCVTQSNSESNAYLLRKHLFINKAAAATFIPLFEDDETPEQAAEHANQKLSSIGRYTYVLLGLGTDGHTASLFPKAKNLSHALAADAQNCVVINPITHSIMRITQSKQRLMKSDNIAFHLVGENKISILNAVFEDTTCAKFPAAFFIHQNVVPLNIYFAEQH